MTSHTLSDNRDRASQRPRTSTGYHVHLRRAAFNGESGMSLVETLIAMMLMLVVMGAVYGIWNGLDRTFTFTNDDLLAQEQARNAMGEMVELVRTARSPESAPTEALNAVVPQAMPNRITVWADVDKDANHDLELIRFRVDPATKTLWRDQAAANGNFHSGTSERLVSTNVVNTDSQPLFTYYDSAGTTLPLDIHGRIEDTSAIRQVAINLLVDVYADRRPVTHQLTSIVQPRNLRQY